MNYYKHDTIDFPINTKISMLPLVYVLATSDLKLTKIGMTKSPKQRFVNIQSGCPFPISIWLGIRTPKPKEIEAYLLKKYESFNLRGEWFSFDDKTLDELVSFFNKTNVHIRSVKNALLQA